MAVKHQHIGRGTHSLQRQERLLLTPMIMGAFQTRYANPLRQ